MSLTSEQIAELQAKAAEADELRVRLAAVDSNKGKILDEKKGVQNELEKAQLELKEIKDKKKEEEGQLQELLDEARAAIKELEKRLADKDTEIAEIQTTAQKDRAKSDFLAEFGPSVFAPKQFWTLFKDSAIRRDGQTYVAVGGKEVPVKGLAEALRKDTEFSHHFKPSGPSGGMGSRASSQGSAADQSAAQGNPFLPGGSVTARIALKRENPDLAARLRAEAEAPEASRRQG
jgi:hypothetical protein